MTLDMTDMTDLFLDQVFLNPSPVLIVDLKNRAYQFDRRADDAATDVDAYALGTREYIAMLRSRAAALRALAASAEWSLSLRMTVSNELDESDESVPSTVQSGQVLAMPTATVAPVPYQVYVPDALAPTGWYLFSIVS